MTSDQIRRAGLEALGSALGPAGMIRFLQQFETGRGDYSRERRRLLGKASVKTVVRRIRQQRKEQ
jgi:hypothetical protein